MSAAASVFKASQLPENPGVCGWVALLPPRAGTPPLAEAITADVTVIGGGFAGLSAARRLAQLDPTLKVVVLEAGVVGDGPAGRNSGFIIDLPHEVSSEDYGGDSLQKSREHIALQRRAVTFATELAAEEGWGRETLDPCGRYNLAMTPDGDKHIADYAAQLVRLGEAHTMLDAEAIAGVTGSRGLHLGHLHAGHGDRAARGLRPRARRQPEAAGPPLRANAGALVRAQGRRLARPDAEGLGREPPHRARQQRLCRALRLLPRQAAARLHLRLDDRGVRPRPPRRPAGLGGDAGLADGHDAAPHQRPRAATACWCARATPTTRASASAKRTLRRAGARHDGKFAHRFPSLAGTRMEYRWGGAMALTWNGVPAFGEVEPGVLAACGCNGLGASNATASGLAAAETLLGVGVRADPDLPRLRQPAGAAAAAADPDRRQGDARLARMEGRRRIDAGRSPIPAHPRRNRREVRRNLHPSDHAARRRRRDRPQGLRRRARVADRGRGARHHHRGLDRRVLRPHPAGAVRPRGLRQGGDRHPPAADRRHRRDPHRGLGRLCQGRARDRGRRHPRRLAALRDPDRGGERGPRADHRPRRRPADHALQLSRPDGRLDGRGRTSPASASRRTSSRSRRAPAT